MRSPVHVVLALTLLAVACTTGAALAARKPGGVSFEGILLREQDAITMEKGLLRSDLRVLRGFRSLEAQWVLVAPSRAAWDRDLAPGFLPALDRPPVEFKTFAKFLPASIGRAGPDVAGAMLHVELPAGRGKGLVAFCLPPLLSEAREGTPLLNSPQPNLGRWISGIDVGSAQGAERPALSSFYLPAWPSQLGLSGPPDVPLRPLPGGGGGSLVLFGGEVAEGEGGGALRDSLWEYATRQVLPAAPMGTFPRRLDALGQMLRSVRLQRPALDTSEGAYTTLSQAEANWTVAERPVRHPTRYLALVAPVVAEILGEDEAPALHSAVVAIVAYYTPLLMDVEEAALWLGVPAEEFGRAVHDGEIPFLRDGQDLLFYRGHLARWARGEARQVPGKMLDPREAAEQALSWGEKYKLRGIERASRGPLPQRFAPIPEKERADLADQRVVARGGVDRDDLASWLRHFEPGLKPGELPPAWSFVLPTAAAELPVSFSLEGPWQPPAPAATAAVGQQAQRWDSRGQGRGGGGAAATADLSSGTVGPAQAAWAGDLSLELLDLYSTAPACPVGSEVNAAVEFDLDGVPEGSTARLRVEWDLLSSGRSVRRDAWDLERGPGSHEVEFAVRCPDEEGPAKLHLALLAPGHEGLVAGSEIPLDVRPPGGRTWPALRMPEPMACLAGAGGEGEEDADGFSIGGSAGLTGEQVSEAVRAFQHQTLRCRDGRVASGTVVLDVVVGCDGRVVAAEVISDDTGSAGFADCIADVIRYAPFPAHDMPDGMSFGLPLRYE